MSSGRLVVCPTPIGNLADVTLRVLSTLQEADVVACEDTRHTGRLLAHHGVRAKALVSYHEHNESARTPKLLSQLHGGSLIALVTDAGMPSVSDPGYVLIRAALEAGVRVEVLPGPSAPVTAVVASGLPADRWRFVGFLPRRASDLAAVFASPETVVAFESPRRLPATLSALVDVDPSRPLAVCRELTKLHGEVVRGDAASVAARFAAAQPRGEIVLVIGAAAASSSDLGAAADSLAALVEAGAKPRPAAKVVAELTGVSANKLYAELQARRA
jgi:16S rRNA (cytidine1402-2'-O)-methyltransferase